MSDLLKKSWQGFLRPDGRRGIRNLVLIVYTVECAQHVSYAIASGEEDVHVIGFPGCYDNAYAIRLMLALARHPNVGAVLSVGLGCEYTQPEKISNVVRESGRPTEWFFIQQAGGTRTSVAKGKEIVARLREQIRKETPRVPMTLADLTVGCECGGSDGTSGLAGNPAVGAFFDLLVDAGGRAIFEETVEMIGLREHDACRARQTRTRNSNLPLPTTRRSDIAVPSGNGRCPLETLRADSRPSRKKVSAHLPRAARDRFKVSSAWPNNRAGRVCGFSTACRMSISCNSAIQTRTTRKA